jgi:AcrR family transcriptional regulator
MREKIVDAALERLLTKGQGEVSIRSLAGDLGVTPMALYRYFKNKEELQLALLDAGFRVFGEYLDRHIGRGTAAERARLLAEGFFAFAIEKSAYFELIFLSSRSLPGLRTRREVQEAARPTYVALRNVVRDCIDEGVIPAGDLDATAQGVLAFCVGYAALYISGNMGWSPAEARASFRNAFTTHLANLSREPAAARPKTKKKR